MLGRPADAEDVVQHTFLAADRTFRTGKVPASVRAWLYTVARNACISVLRARREDGQLPDAGVPSTADLAAEVEHREHLRELLGDLRTLPDDQRAALLLAELGDLSHAEVGAVIGVRASKVKALVFQARQTLMATADARAISCRAIREELATATGAGTRRRHLREHVAHCEGCRAFATRVRSQRASLGAILPVVPTAALREGVFAAVGAGTGATAGGAATTGLGALAAKSTAAKLLAIAAIGATAGGGSLAVSALDRGDGGRPAAPAARGSRGVAPATHPAGLPATAQAAARPTIVRIARPATENPPRGAAPRGGRRKTKPNAPRRSVATPPGAPPAGPRRHGNGPPTQHQPAAPGRALGLAKQAARGRTPPGRGRGPGDGKPDQGADAGAAQQSPAGAAASPHPAIQDAKPGNGRPDPPGHAGAAGSPASKPGKQDS